MVTGDKVKARRHARGIVAEMRWRGMIVPGLYARMADQFEDMVRSGEYAAWVAANQSPLLVGRRSHATVLPDPARQDRSGAVRGAPHARWTAPRAPRRGLPLPGVVAGR